MSIEWIRDIVLASIFEAMSEFAEAMQEEHAEAIQEEHERSISGSKETQ